MLKSKLISSLPDKFPGYYSFLNHSSSIYLSKGVYSHELITGYFVDGSILLWYLKYCKGIKNLKRMSFDNASLAPLVFERYRDRQFVFIGGSEGDIELFKVNFERNYPEMKAVFTNGYRDTSEYLKIISNLREDCVVVVGLGAPKQELFLCELAKHNFHCIAFTCGAYITQSAHRWDYYHVNEGLDRFRVIWRLLQEPAKILKRLTLDIFRFLFKTRFIFSYDKH